MYRYVGEAARASSLLDHWGLFLKAQSCAVEIRISGSVRHLRS
jgi:hypothetical protein